MDMPMPVIRERGRVVAALSDAMTMAGRHLRTILRVPQLLVFFIIQPILFVLLFRYALGGAIRAPGLAYVDYLMPGIFAQTVAFGAMATAIGLAEDRQKGLFERFRALPMAGSAVLAGRIASDAVRNLVVVALMCVVGLAVGFRIRGEVLGFLSALLLLLAFGAALSTVFASVGLTVPNAESAQAVAFPLLAPLVFASSAFVPVSSMPGWLQVFAAHQPLTVIVDVVRSSALGGGVGSQALEAIVWTLSLLGVFGPIGAFRYRRAS